MTAAVREAAVRRAAVLGSPIAHSLSPALHRAAYAHLGLPWTYDAQECTAEGLAAFVAGLGPEWVGLSLTMPLKAAVLPLLDDVDPVALRTGAANTVLLGGGRRSGSNTDVPGMTAALAERGVTPSGGANGRASILAGATARSALASLADAGWSSATVYARTPDRADVVAGLRTAVVGTPLDLAVVPWPELFAAGSGGLAAPLVVSTVPAGAADELVGLVPASPGALLDVVYAPWPTALAKGWAASGGGVVVGGLDLLVHQAVLQVALMTGTDVPLGELVAVLREAGVAALTDPGPG